MNNDKAFHIYIYITYKFVLKTLLATHALQNAKGNVMAQTKLEVKVIKYLEICFC